jgi:antibiotic biosynthesis monooxygenase (ABM) superfamily enzyme
MSRPSEVVSVIRHEVRPGSEQAYEAWTQEIVPIAQGFPGHHGVAVIRPAAGSRVYTVVLHFDTVEHLRGWLESDVRAALLARIEPHLSRVGDPEIKGGLDFWLPSPGQPRARPYKQLLVALAVIYPLALLLPLLLEPQIGTWPLPLRTLAVSTLIVWLMTYVVMPRVVKRAGDWLYRE